MAGKITLYTNHSCPYAHRTHIALKELELEFEEVIIDLNTPRPSWYLEINPKGQIPTLKYDEHIITESGIITQFLADLKESYLLPASGSPEGALKRARIAFFLETFQSKVPVALFSVLKADSEEEKTEKATQFVEGIEKDIVPLLEGCGPFFGGSKELTLAEVNTASFVIRANSFIKHGALPAFVGEKLKANKNWDAWAEAVCAKPSVNYIWKEEFTQKMLEKIAASKAKAPESH